MDNHDKLLSIPAIAVILEKILSIPDGVREEEILASDSGKKEAARALEILSGYGLVQKTGGFVAIDKHAGSLEKVRKIIRVFKDLNDITAATLVMRGILTATTYYRCLVHSETLSSMMVKEGIEKTTFEKALAVEEKHGYIERLKITYRARGQVKEKFFPFIPHHHYDDFAEMTGRLVEAVDGGTVLPEDRLSLSEEEYLLGRYPEALAEQARQYLSMRNESLLQRVQNEAFDIVWCYDKY